MLGYPTMKRLNPWPIARKLLLPTLMGLSMMGGVVLLPAACAEEFSCSTDYECPGNTEICVQGACEPFICQENIDCDDPHALCLDNRCVSNAQTPDDLCTTDSDCLDGTQICQNGSCIPVECITDTDCAQPASSCMDNQCVSPSE